MGDQLHEAGGDGNSEEEAPGQRAKAETDPACPLEAEQEDEHGEADPIGAVADPEGKAPSGRPEEDVVNALEGVVVSEPHDWGLGLCWKELPILTAGWTNARLM
jgi:hypothetical protein